MTAERAALLVEGLDAIPYAQKGFLHEILGHGGIAHHAKDQRVGQASIPVVEIRHCLGFAGAETPGQSGIVLEAQCGLENDAYRCQQQPLQQNQAATPCKNIRRRAPAWMTRPPNRLDISVYITSAVGLISVCRAASRSTVRICVIPAS